MKHFKNIASKEELRKAYIALIKKHHPDLGGSTEICQEITAEYQELIKKFNASEFSGVNSKYTYSEADTFDEEIAEILKKIIIFENMKIEIIGFWVWCTNSFEYKDQLKELGFQFSGSKKAWFWYSGIGQKKVFYANFKNLDDIKKKYSSQTVETKKTKKIA